MLPYACERPTLLLNQNQKKIIILFDVIPCFFSVCTAYLVFAKPAQKMNSQVVTTRPREERHPRLLISLLIAVSGI